VAAAAPMDRKQASLSPGEASAPAQTRRALRWLPWILGVGVLVAVVIGALHLADAREFARLAEQAEPGWLFLAVVFQAATYLAQGQVFRCMAHASGFSLRVAAACRIGFMKLFVDQAVPSGGLSGTLVLSDALQQQAMSRPAVASAIVVDFASYYAAYVLSIAGALVITAVRGETRTVIVVSSVALFLFGMGLSSLVLVFFRATRSRAEGVAPSPPRADGPGLHRRRGSAPHSPSAASCQDDRLSAWDYRMRCGDPLDPASLAGRDGLPSGVFASFMVSSLLRSIGFTPGGLGIFEAASVATLKMVGVPIGAALAATLLFRGLSFWLPMLPGLWFTRHALARPAT
jgi:uncharacterized membrane protein YbhN (UPF0104 family)